MIQRLNFTANSMGLKNNFYGGKCVCKNDNQSYTMYEILGKYSHTRLHLIIRLITFRQ